MKWPTKVPSNWTTCKAGLVLKPLFREPLPGDEIVTAFRDGQVTLRKNRREDGFTNAAKEIGYQHIEDGDLVVHSMDGGFGAIGVADSSGKASPVVHAYRSSKCDLHFIAYYLRAAVHAGWIRANGKGIRERSTQFDRSALAKLEISFPPLETQRRIADYLDRETGQIDSMIDKLGAVTQELSQRRAGMIQRHTVNAGGNLTRLKFCADVSLGKTFQGTQKQPSERFVNYVRAASIQTHGLELDDQRMWMTDAELDKHSLFAEDVLIVEGGAGYGRSVVLSRTMPEWGFQNHVIRVRPDNRSDGRFLNYCVRANFDAGLIDILVDGATIPSLSSEKARELPVLAVPLEEQRRIADHLDEVTSKIDAMLSKVAELKDLLTERRAALITDVVTGRKEVV